MKNINWKVVLSHVAAVILFQLLAIFYNSALLDGKRLVSHDDTQYRGAAKEVNDYREKEGEEALWMNNMFAGMPAYTVSYSPNNNWVGNIFYKVGVLVPVPATQLFWAMLCFYIMLCTFGFKPYASAIGAISYGFCSYNIGIVTAGHYAKFWAIAFFPLIVAGVNMIFKKKYLWGALVTGVATSIEIIVNHPQMTYYYFVFFLSLFMVYLFIQAVIKKEIKHAIIASVLSVGMIGVGLMSNANRLLPVNEYTAYSTRGKSDLKQSVDASDQTSGLNKSYIVGYSSGRDDIYSFLVPNYKGYNSWEQLVMNDKAKEAMGKNKNLVAQTEQATYGIYGEGISTYWGGTDLAAGGTYCSVLIFALFLMGFLFVKHPVKWLIIPAFLITLFLSWGKNYMSFSNFFIENFPMYNKFRAVNSIIIVITFCIPLLASFMIARMANEPEFLEKPFAGKVKNKVALVGGLGFITFILLLMLAMPTMFQSFFKPAHMVDKVQQVMTEREIIEGALTQAKASDQQISQAMNAIQDGRIAIFRADVLRSLLVMILGTVAIALYAFKVYKWPIMLALVGVIVLVDTWTYDQRFLNADAKNTSGEKYFQVPKDADKSWTPTMADKQILSDPAIHKRVLNLTVSPFNDGTTSYYHQSLGGYSGAKIKRYQELVERGIYPEINTVYSAGTMEKMDSVLRNTQVLNMLNTKYMIFPTEQGPVPFPNNHANGAAWTVSEIKFVPDADAEIAALSSTNTKTTAIADEKFKDKINTANLRPDSTAKVTITKLSPKLLEYDYNSVQDQIVVFSEIYYPAGWNAYVDGEPTEIIRVNYVLRAIYVPKGKHKIEMMFEPKSFVKGERYSMIGSLIMLLLFGAGIGFEIRKYMKRDKSAPTPTTGKK